jgi:hypothetical protein
MGVCLVRPGQKTQLKVIRLANHCQSEEDRAASFNALCRDDLDVEAQSYYVQTNIGISDIA